MNQSRIIKGLFLALGIISLQSCDKDFSNIGGDIIGDGSLQIKTYNVEDIISYNQEFGAMDTKNLIETPLGSLNNEVFGSTTSSLVAQLDFNQAAFSTIGKNAIIDSVYVYIPYYSTFEKVDNNIQYYKLQNVYGEGSFDLEVFQNGYFMNSADVSDGSNKKYYSNDSAIFDDNKVGSKLNTGKESQNTAFTFNKTSIIIPQIDKDGNPVFDKESGNIKAKETLSPGMWLDLNKQYFQDQWFANKDKFTDGSSFKDYFRGLYFKAKSNTGSSNGGAIGLLNLAKGKLVINYRYDDITKDKDGNEVVTRKRQSISLSFISNDAAASLALNKNINVNLFKTTKSDTYTKALASSNKTKGDEKLFVKGTEGSVGVVSLFQKNAGEELQTLRDKNIMVNDAILTVYVDKEMMKDGTNPPRLQLYNYDNESYIADFVLDKTTIQGIIKPYYGGIFEKEDKDKNKAGYVYRIRLTQHIVNLIKNKEANNTKLAIIASNEYNGGLMDFMTFKTLKTPISNTPKDITLINPFMISCPVGTVLNGANSGDLNKRMKLEIFYTQKNN